MLFAGGTGITAFTAFLEEPDAGRRHGRSCWRTARGRSDLLIYRDIVERCARRLPSLDVSYFVEHDDGRERFAGDRRAGYRSDARLAATAPAASRRDLLHLGAAADAAKHRRRISAPATFLRRRFTLTPGNSDSATSPSFWRDRPVFVTGATGLARRLAGQAPPRRGRRRRRASCATGCPARSSSPAGLIDRVRVVRGRRTRSGDDRARAGRVRDRDRLPSGGADDGGRGEPESGLDARYEHPRHVGAARGLPPEPDGQADCHRLVRQGIRRSGGAAVYRETRRCRAGIPYDVSKSCADLHGADVRDTPTACRSASRGAATSTAAAI